MFSPNYSWWGAGWKIWEENYRYFYFKISRVDFLYIITLNHMKKEVVVYQLAANYDEIFKKSHLCPPVLIQMLLFLSAKLLLWPLPTVGWILGILVVPWGSHFGMLPLSCSTIFFPLNKKTWAFVKMVGENKPWKHLYFFPRGGEFLISCDLWLIAALGLLKHRMY